MLWCTSTNSFLLGQIRSYDTVMVPRPRSCHLHKWNISSLFYPILSNFPTNQIANCNITVFSGTNYVESIFLVHQKYISHPQWHIYHDPSVDCYDCSSAVHFWRIEKFKSIFRSSQALAKPGIFSDNCTWYTTVEKVSSSWNQGLTLIYYIQQGKHLNNI